MNAPLPPPLASLAEEPAATPAATPATAGVDAVTAVRQHATWVLATFLIALSFFAMRSLVERFDSLGHASLVRHWAGMSEELSFFIHELQRERGLASGFIASSGRLFGTSLRQQYGRTDESLEHLREHLPDLPLSTVEMERLTGELDRVRVLRQHTGDLKLSREFVVDHYSGIIDHLFNLQLDTFGVGTESAIFRQQMAFIAFMQAKEKIGQQRALVSAMLTDRNFSAGRMALLQSIEAVGEARLSLFDRLADPLNRQAFQAIQELPEMAQILAVLQRVRAAGLREAAHGSVVGMVLPRAEEWFALSTARIDAMKRLEDELSRGVLRGAIEYERRERYELAFNALLALLAFIMAGVLIHQVRRDRLQTRLQLNLADTVFENSVQSILVTDVQGRIIAVNPAFEQASGYDRAEVLGNTPRILRSGRHDAAFYAAMWAQLAREGSWRGEIWNRRKSGEIYPALLSIAAVHDAQGQISNYTGMIFDLSQHKAVARLLDELRTFDGLTGLPNRESWVSALDQGVASAVRNRLTLAVLEVDIDRFKLVNDTLGHQIGDKLLIEFAERIKTCLRRHDVVARPGGNRFSVLLSEISSPQDVGTICEKLMSAFSRPVELEGVFTQLTASIGAAIFPEDGQDSKTLMMAAESALYSAKADGRNLYKFYSPEMNELGSTLFKVERMLRMALEREEFTVVYQPQVCARGGHLVGVEALLRWHNPELGNVSPVQFIPIAEETGLIVPIGEWVMRTACRQAALWRQTFDADIPVAVNLSARQFRRNDLFASVQQVLDETGLPAHLLELEITEGLLMTDPIGATDLIRGLNFAGIKTALDDFGTGYSSLAYLKTFPLNRLKIDRAFVRDLPDSDSDCAIANTVITLGLNLQMEVLAEGVETQAQADFLAASGCQVFQGYLFGKPMPGEELSASIADGRFRLSPAVDRSATLSAS